MLPPSILPLELPLLLLATQGPKQQPWHLCHTTGWRRLSAWAPWEVPWASHLLLMVVREPPTLLAMWWQHEPRATPRPS